MKVSLKLLFAFALFFTVVSCGKKKKDTLKTITSATVSTTAVYNITNSSASCDGLITDAGGGEIFARGICWGVNQFPTIENNSKSIDGSGTGKFTGSLINLQGNHTYYVRAYATNEVGTSYGDDIKFTTSPFASFPFNGETIFIHPVDNGSSVWGPPGVTTGAVSSSDGSANTIYIAGQEGTYAAKVCADLVAYGYSDWYLPSSQELGYIFQAKTVLGGFGTGDYWTSNETSAQNAVSLNFQNGAQAGSTNKAQIKLCRCVRKE